MVESITNLDGIKLAVGEAFRKHRDEYDSEIIAIPIARPSGPKVIYRTEELTAVCPLTGLPDFYDLNIEFHPRDLVPELKTLKFYLLAFRDVGVLHEDFAMQIAEAIQEKCDGHYICVTLLAKVRGGLATDVYAELGTRVH